MNIVSKDISSFSSQKNRKLYSAMKPHLISLFFLDHANVFLILTEEPGNRSITLASSTLRSLIVLYILALLDKGIAWPPLL